MSERLRRGKNARAFITGHELMGNESCESGRLLMSRKPLKANAAGE